MSTTRGKALAAKRKKVTNRRGKSSPAVSPSAKGEIEGFIIDEGLTPQQFIFVEELCADATKPVVQAVRIAYPDQNTNAQYVTAHNLLRLPKIAAAITRRLGPQLHKTRTSREAVTKVIGEGMHWDPAVIYNEDGSIRPVREWPAEARRQLVSVEVNEITIGTGPKAKVIGYTKKVRFSNRQEYTTLAARMNRMLTDKVQHEVGETLEQLLTRVHQGEA